MVNSREVRLQRWRWNYYIFLCTPLCSFTVYLFLQWNYYFHNFNEICFSLDLHFSDYYEAEHIFIYLLITCIYSSVNCPFIVFAHFSNEEFIFLYQFARALFINNINHFLVIYIANIFPGLLNCFRFFLCSKLSVFSHSS